MSLSLKGGLGLLRQTVRDFLEDDCPNMAASLSYYTIFSLPPLLTLLLLLLGAVLDPRDVSGAIERQMEGLMGSSAGEQVRTIISHADRPASGALAAVLGVLALVFGATGAFGQLQAALNRAWEVAPDPQQGGLRNFLTKRLFTFGMVLGIAFLLLVSLALTAALAALGDALGALGGLSEPLLHALNAALSFAVITLLFAALFRVVPDARVAWRDVWVGAVTTAGLFVLGKFLIGLYLGRSNPGQAYGAAGSLALMLLWVYYSSLILLFGAEFTQTWAERKGRGIEPEPGAVRVVEERRHLRTDPPGSPAG